VFATWLGWLSELGYAGTLYLLGWQSVPGCGTIPYPDGLAIPGCADNLYLAGLVICTWLCWQPTTWLGWLSVPGCTATPLPGWACCLAMTLLATFNLAGLALCTWLLWQP